MRYWVYLNDKVLGPYDEAQMKTLDGFTPDTLICKEVLEEGEAQEWVPAKSLIKSLDAAPQEEQPAAQNVQPAAEAQPVQEVAQPVQGSQPTAQEQMVPVYDDIGLVSENLNNTDSSSVTDPNVKTDSNLVLKLEQLSEEVSLLRKEIEKLVYSAPAPIQQAPVSTEDYSYKPSQVSDYTSPMPKLADLSPQTVPGMNTETAQPVEQQPEVKQPEAILPEAQPVEHDRDLMMDLSLQDAPIVPELNVQPLKQGTPNKLQEPFSAEALDEAKTFTLPAASEEEGEILSAMITATNSGLKKEINPGEVTFEDLLNDKESAPAPAPMQKDEMTGLTSVPEVNLNEATSLISDFIPPSEVAGGDKKPGAQPVPQQPNQQDSDLIKTTTINAPEIKRVKPTDLKTDPLIIKGSGSSSGISDEELASDKIEGIDQFGTMEEDTAMEEIKKPSKAKALIKVLLLLVLLAAAYAGVVYMKFVPDTFGLLPMMGVKEQPAAPLAPAVPSAPALPVVPDIDGNMPAASPSDARIDSAVTSVKAHLLPNGKTVEQLVNEKHPLVKELIEWTGSELDSETYAVSAKVPPESEMTLRMIYRFSYNPLTNVLTPTTSDSKNLLGV